MDEIHLAVLVTKAQAVPSDGAGGGEEDQIYEELGGGILDIEEFKHTPKLETYRSRCKRLDSIYLFPGWGCSSASLK